MSTATNAASNLVSVKKTENELRQYDIGQIFDMPQAKGRMALGWDSVGHPAVPRRNKDYVFRVEPLREILAFLNNPRGDALFITGPTGSGKTSCVNQVLSRLHWPTQFFTMSGRVEFQDLVGQFRLVSKNPGEPPVMVFVHGVLPQAMKEGHVLLINEADVGDPSQLVGLNDIIEGNPLVIAENAGEVIHPHKMFRVIFTGNSTGCGDDTGHFQGVLKQNLAFMDRCRMLEIGYMEVKEEQALLSKLVPDLPAMLVTPLVTVANSIRKSFMGDSGTGADGKISVTMSTRTLLRWAALAVDFTGHAKQLQYALDISLLRKIPKSDAGQRLAIEQMAQSVLGDEWIGNTTI